jgi:SAM-dependent methyltransferase
VYRLGEKGRNELNDILSDAIRTVHDFYGQYLLKLPPETNVFDRLCSLLTDRLSDMGNIALIASKYSVMIEKMIHALSSKASRSYFIKPRSVASGPKLDDVVLLEGDYLDVPLKDGHIDLLLVIDTPPKDVLKESVKEWHRTLKKSGHLAVLIPTILVRPFQDPLTIGDFLERHEHNLSEEKVDKNLLKLSLGKLFDNVEERQIVHMTLFLASGPRSSR